MEERRKSYTTQYLDKNLNIGDLIGELKRLIGEYNRERKCYLIIYAASMNKPIPQVPIEQEDYYIIYDLLKGNKGIQKNVDFYIETPGGRGETAEDIVHFLHDNFEKVAFIVSGEAKSAGTIMVLSGDEILMTETGSLGPIDAQVKIGRSIVSAHDYVHRVEEIRNEAEKNGKLNPFDAVMVAQISPGELDDVFHALKFAEDLVIQWLVDYKFKNWTVTETQKKTVTKEMKQKRAKKIASDLTNHAKWRVHGRSIKIKDLEDIGLKITRIEDNPKLTDIVFRIQTVIRLLFERTTIYKIFATEDRPIFKTGVKNQEAKLKPSISDSQQAEAVQIKIICQKCGSAFSLYAKLQKNPQIDQDLQNQGFLPFPKDGKFLCKKCGFEIDLLGIKDKIEMDSKQKIILE